MPDNDISGLVAVVESWQLRKTAGREFKTSDLRSFVETMNYYTKRIISITDIQDPDVWQSFAELCTQAATVCTPGAKVFADGKDVTNL